MKHILKSYGIPAETVNAIMMLYMNIRSMVRSPDGDTQFFEITTCVLQGNTIAPFLFIICLDYVLKSSIDYSSNFSFTLKKRRSRRHPATYITDTDYADDIAITADSMENIKQLLNQVEEKTKYIGLKINCGKTEYMSFNQKDDHVLTNSESTTTLTKVKLYRINCTRCENRKGLGSNNQHDENMEIKTIGSREILPSDR